VRHARELSEGYFDVYRWDDLRFPGQAINPAGLLAPPTQDNTTGLLVFSGIADNIVAGVAQMPHAWKAGSSIYPHLHLIATTSNAGKNSRWKFEYNRANNTENFEVAYGSYNAMTVMTVPNPAATSQLLLPSGWGELSMAGYRESSCIMWRVSRLAASDAADDDINDWVLVEFDIHYQSDKMGTVPIIPV